MNCYVKLINTKRYEDYKITGKCCGVESQFKRSSETRIICESKFQKQRQLMTKELIPLCENSSDIYYFNILRITAIICQIYIESESFNLTYKNIQIWVYEHEF